MGTKYTLLSKGTLKAASGWIILLVGAACFIIGFCFTEEGGLPRQILLKVGDVLVIGGILSYLSNTAQFLGLFKKDLQDIIYGKEFVGKRGDIEDIWACVSKEMFKDKFEPIHEQFLNVIKGYLICDDVSFYDTYESHHKIEWINKNENIISVTESVSFKLIAESEKTFSYPLRTWIASDAIKENEKMDTSLWVDDKQVPLGKSIEHTSDGNKETLINIPLKGKKVYKIRYERVKKYDISKDFFIGFRAKYIVNNLRTSIQTPDDIKCMFIARGTQKDFEISGIDTDTRIERKYEGILLPKQGYVFALYKTN